MSFQQLIQGLQTYQPVYWHNQQQHGLAGFHFGRSEVEDAEARLQRFAPFIHSNYPETEAWEGLIESPLVTAPRMKEALARQYPDFPSGHALYLKRDDQLPISGSIKARGGIYEVLKIAEQIALENGILQPDMSTIIFNESAVKQLLAQHTLVVGSTGNLGLSIGLMGRKLGFSVRVTMSSDAREWKKQKLRSIGAEVIEFPGDFTAAVAKGREFAATHPDCHFIDDESSYDLFFGYAVAAARLSRQLKEAGISVSPESPLFVSLPCGVGGGPAGIAFGLKLLFGEAVHCLIAEPTHAPSMLLGVASGKGADISIGDIGLDGITAADGLAVGRPSALAAEMLTATAQGFLTVPDQALFETLRLLNQTESITVEPSACAGFASLAWQREIGFAQYAHATHLIWLTGGGMVPSAEMQRYLDWEPFQAENR
jgi:D-serine dehydratase